MSSIFPFNATATPEIYTLSLHDALPIYYFGMSVPYQFGESVLLAWFYLVAVLGFTFFFSSLFKSTSYSILVTAVLFLFAFNLIETLVANLVQIEPWFILTYGAQIIGSVLSTEYPTHTTTRRE